MVENLLKQVQSATDDYVRIFRVFAVRCAKRVAHLAIEEPVQRKTLLDKAEDVGLGKLGCLEYSYYMRSEGARIGWRAFQASQWAHTAIKAATEFRPYFRSCGHDYDIELTIQAAKGAVTAMSCLGEDAGIREQQMQEQELQRVLQCLRDGTLPYE